MKLIDLPLEIISGITSFITNPDDALALARSATYFRDLIGSGLFYIDNDEEVKFAPDNLKYLPIIGGLCFIQIMGDMDNELVKHLPKASKNIRILNYNISATLTIDMIPSNLRVLMLGYPDDKIRTGFTVPETLHDVFIASDSDVQITHPLQLLYITCDTSLVKINTKYIGNFIITSFDLDWWVECVDNLFMFLNPNSANILGDRIKSCESLFIPAYATPS